MKKKWLKKGSAVLLTAAMVLSLFPGMKGTLATVKAAENTAPTPGYWTDAAGLRKFSLANATDTVGKVIFGQNGSGSAQKWKIAGVDSKINGGNDNIILFADTPLGTSVFEDDWQNNKTFSTDWNCTYSDGTSITEVYPNHYGASDLRSVLQGYANNSAYFSSAEQGKMNNTTIYTNDTKNSANYTITDKLYAPYGDIASGNDNYVTVGTNVSDNLNDGVKINISKWGKVLFWLRSPGNTFSDAALVADPGNYVSSGNVDHIFSVVPAFNLNLSSDIFASAAEAASSSYSGYKANSAMTENTYTLRYTYTTGTDSAVINSNGTQVKVTNASGKYLMIQNSTGVFALQIQSDDKTVTTSDITGMTLDNFNNCKVWIESTTDRITTAKMATQDTVTTINSVAVTDITAPVAGSTLDIEAGCATTGVTNTTPTVTWTPNATTAGYNTTYTASVILTAAENYEFASGATATVNGQNATSVTKNQDGTLTVTYTFSATDTAKLISITEPTGITVANGTAYVDMGLPTNVAIVTEGNTETTAAVAWDTTIPDSGSYNPAVLTEQSVTLKGTVTCPSNIDQNNVTLSTTITVTISAAGIVGTPTFVPVAGTYTENQSVVLSSSTDGATIYYTTDGTTPTTGSDVYSGAISVTGTAGESISTTIKAIAVKDGMQTSSIASATYVIEIPAPAPSAYAVTVNNGTGDANYAAGATVTITADAAPSGQEFDKWTVVSGGVTLASATSATTTFEMPANAVEVTAAYKNKPSDPNPPAPTPTYTITAGAGQTHELSTDGTLTITCDGALDKLTGIYVDDKLVDAANYTLKSGSTILTFKAAYLNTLSAGTHKVKIQYSDGSVESTFVIKEASTQDTTQETTPSEKDEVPKTGDSTPIAWLFVIAIISGAGVVYFGRKKKIVR